MAPIIGISGAYLVFTSELFHSSESYRINKSYLEAVKENGGLPLPIPILEDPEHLKTYIDMCDALLIPGGADVDPMYFDEDPHQKLGVVQPDMDKYEIALLNLAFERKMPVLGICRGEQVINVAKGGTLYQDISATYEKESILHQQRYRTNIALHKIKVEKNSLLYEILGSEDVRTNTMHHQSVKALGKDLVVSAVAPDGIIEAIESTDKTVIGVQWHPELLIHTQSEMNNLFKHFIQKMAMDYKKSK
ncbi:MAG: gamma-glutamyl-gamma-aminobutyrate hydrolase family protein [Defluviitaleaceae bacterium]|nr:gamma-glutamyl-gamma-aminobutyrate hydrolase family protein [Defluviitaleaceae bacterium]